MKLVNMRGGLGNLMFQYAFYLSLKNKCPGTTLVPYYGFLLKHSNIESHEKNHLESIFNLQGEGRLLALASRFARRFCKEVKDYDIKCQPQLLRRPCSKWEYFNGYWQSEKYFTEIHDQVRSIFTFKDSDSVICSSVLAEIQKQNSVSLHVRRGDYLTLSRYVNLSKTGYYDSAISYMQKHLTDPVFFIFSDDIEWCKNTFQGEQFQFVDCNGKDYAHLDMYLMTQCNHNIIANSSFSWWGAWLNRNKGQIVLAPKEWYSAGTVVYDIDNLLPGNWVRN